MNKNELTLSILKKLIKNIEDGKVFLVDARQTLDTRPHNTPGGTDSTFMLLNILEISYLSEVISYTMESEEKV